MVETTLGARSFTFSHAITRKPGQSITDGLRAVDTGAPSLELMESHHKDYVAALKSTGAQVVELPALEQFPDGLFVEDAALCLREGAVIMRPGAPSRLGESAAIAPTLLQFYEEVAMIEGLGQGSGYVEGGDILVTEREILVGLSKRTDTMGVKQLRDIVSRWDYTVREVATPHGVLHFKTDCSLLDAETILSTRKLSNSGCFDGYEVIHVAEGEEAAANTIRFNDLVIMPSGFPKTAEILDKAGYNVREIGNSECAKLDGGMSCLSLRFSRSV
jgi:dimethylargininase